MIGVNAEVDPSLVKVRGVGARDLAALKRTSASKV